MSFLGYIGKTLGAGTAPIVNANAASQSDIQFREFRENAPNREELTRIAMEQARRTEQVAKDAEAERQRGQAYLQKRREAGLSTPNMAVTPDISETAPTTLQPTPKPTAPAGLPASTAPVVSTTPAYVPTTAATTTPSATSTGSTPASSLFDLPTRTSPYGLDTRIGELRDVTGRITGLEARAEAINSRVLSSFGTRVPTGDTKKLRKEAQEIQTELNSLRNRQKILQRQQASDEAVNQALDQRAAAAPAAATAANIPAFAAPLVAGLTGAPPAAAPAAAALAAAPAAAPAVTVPGADVFMPIVNKYASQFPNLPYDIIVPTASMLAGGESPNFGLKAKNKQHIGAFQFNEANQKEYGQRLKAYNLDLTTAEGQTLAAMMLMDDNAKALKSYGVNDITPINLVSAHNQGARGFAALVNHPDMNAAEALDTHAFVKDQPGKLRVSEQAWMDPKDVATTTARQFVEGMQAYYGKYSPTYSNVKSSPINPDIYRGDPDGLTFDMQQAEFLFNLTQQQRDDALNLIDASDPFSAAAQEQLADAYTLTKRLVEQSGIYSQLQITKGLTSAFGGDTSYLNGVLSGVMDYPIEVRATAGDQGIDYQVTAGGQPVSDSLDYDGMKQFVMRIADSQYDAELTTLEVAAEAKENEITMQLSADVQRILAKGSVDFALAENKAKADYILAALNAEFEKQGQGVEIKKLADGPNGEVLATDTSGRVYKVTTSRKKLNGKMVDFTSLELVDVEGLSE